MFLAGLGASLIGGALPLAAQQCVPLAPGVSGCNLKLSKTFKIVTQDCAERCWAASIAAIFEYYDHPIDQDVIAQTVFGTVACQGSHDTKVLDAVLDHDWTDSNGDKFTAHITGLYDPLNNLIDMNNGDIISELKQDSPLLYCNTHHAMVIVGVSYRQGAAPNLVAIDRVQVADPFPGQGFHYLSLPEMVPLIDGGQVTYVASVAIDD
jgi:hypothetical protein